MDSLYNINNNFWIVAQQRKLSAAAIATYFFLVHEANRNRWPPSFPCATELLCTMTGSHKSTIIRARAALKAAGLIDFKEGHIGRSSPIYSLKAAGLRQCSPKQSSATTASTTVATTHATSSATLYKEIDKNKYNFKEYGKCKSKQTDRRRGSEVPDASPEEYSAPF